MLKLGILGAVALSLALAVTTPAFAAEFHGVRGGDAMDAGGFGGTQAIVPSKAAAHCAHRILLAGSFNAPKTRSITPR
jgi:hypothetical protein